MTNVNMKINIVNGMWLSFRSIFQNRSCLPRYPSFGRRNAYTMLKIKRKPYMQSPMAKSKYNWLHSTRIRYGAISKKIMGTFFAETHFPFLCRPCRLAN